MSIVDCSGQGEWPGGGGGSDSRLTWCAMTGRFWMTSVWMLPREVIIPGKDEWDHDSHHSGRNLSLDCGIS